MEEAPPHCAWTSSLTANSQHTELRIQPSRVRAWMPVPHKCACGPFLIFKPVSHLQDGYYGTHLKDCKTQRQTYSRISGNPIINLKNLTKPPEWAKTSSEVLDDGRFVGRNSRLHSFTKVYFSNITGKLFMKLQGAISTSCWKDLSSTPEGLTGQVWVRLAQTRASRLFERSKMSSKAMRKRMGIEGSSSSTKKIISNNHQRLSECHQSENCSLNTRSQVTNTLGGWGGQDQLGVVTPICNPSAKEAEAERW